MTDLVHMPALLSDLFKVPRSEARRVLNQGGVREVDGDRIVDFDVPRERIDGAHIQYGRTRRATVHLDSPAFPRQRLTNGGEDR